MSEEFRSQLLIIGSGPAGCTAAIYAVRAGIKTTQMLGPQPGGQLSATTEIENFPGFAHFIKGSDLTEAMLAQAKKLGTIQVYDEVVDVDFSSKPFRVKNGAGASYLADAVIIATGAKAKHLGVLGEDTYRGAGVSYCATCDGFFFRNKRVVIVGGGNTAVEEAAYLSGLAKQVTLIHRRNELRADKTDQDKLFSLPNINIVWDSAVMEIFGGENKQVASVAVKNLITEEVCMLETDGVFVAIGHTPATSIFINKLDLDEGGYILSDGAGKTSVDGIFAAGDVASSTLKQAVIAAASGCIAANSAKFWLEKM
ncbi:MAG: thioredoxin-disulfide reductase [Holosporales bacterium]|jgi:thioredoxin reductase (NADPH)|nr:thioredoxin-disulfide reductase [Holosporales bacterium]